VQFHRADCSLVIIAFLVIRLCGSGTSRKKTSEEDSLETKNDLKEKNVLLIEDKGKPRQRSLVISHSAMFFKLLFRNSPISASHECVCLCV